MFLQDDKDLVRHTLHVVNVANIKNPCSASDSAGTALPVYYLFRGQMIFFFLSGALHGHSIIPQRNVISNNLLTLLSKDLQTSAMQIVHYEIISPHH